MVSQATWSALQQRALHSPHIHAMYAAIAGGCPQDEALAQTVLALEEALTKTHAIAVDAMSRCQPRHLYDIMRDAADCGPPQSR